MCEALGALQDRSFAAAASATASSYPPERRLGPAQLARYLDRRVFAVVGSCRPGGRPHAAMSSYVRRGTTFWLPTVSGSVRERNLRRQPWLTMTVTHGDRGEHVVVLIEGPATMVAPTAVPAGVRAAITGDWAGGWIRLDATRLFSYAAEGAAT